MTSTALGEPLGKLFYERDVLEVAPELLNKVFAFGGVAGRIVEVEAYRGSDDPASHAFRGQTPRNTVMFGRPGRLYTYFTYGMHWCANVVCLPDGVPGAVLLRAVAPISGLDVMYSRRAAASRDRDLCSGPAKLCQAFGIGQMENGAELDLGPLVLDDGFDPPTKPASGRRIGISRGKDVPWRFCVRGDLNVSLPRL